MNKRLYTVACILITASLCLLNITYGANAATDTAVPAAAQTKTSNTGAIVGGVAAATAIAGSITAGVISNTKNDDSSITKNNYSSASGDELDKQLQALLEQYRAQYHVLAMQASISLPGETKSRDFVSGVTQYGGTTKVNTENLFEIGSITKSFIAAIILQLETENKLSVDDPIGKYLDTPKFHWPSKWPAEWKAITIKQLLNMTSGIFNFVADEGYQNAYLENPSKHFYNVELVNYAANHPDYFSPGQGWKYSNTDYIIAGLVIHEVTGKTIEQVMQERFLGPNKYNLLNTYYSDYIYPDDIATRTVHGYQYAGGMLYDFTNPNVSSDGASGNMLSNTNNITLWVRALFGGQVLKPQQFAEMQSLVCMDASFNCIPGQAVTKQIGGYGLGLAEENIPPYGEVWLYEGMALGYVFYYVWIPSYNTVITVAGDVRENYDYLHDLVNDILGVLYNSPEWQQYRSTHKGLLTATQPVISKNYGSLIKLHLN